MITSTLFAVCLMEHERFVLSFVDLLAKTYPESGTISSGPTATSDMTREVKLLFFNHYCPNDDTYVIMCTLMISLRKSSFKKVVIHLTKAVFST
jgi:hypothetical protein